MPSHYLFLGASRNIGLHTVTSLLTSTTTSTCTLLLRNPTQFRSENQALESYISQDRLRLVKGDAKSSDSIQQVWAESGRGSRTGQPEIVIYSLGGSRDGISLTKGFKISPPDICSATITVLLAHMHSLATQNVPLPRLIAISSSGLTHAEHKKLPRWEQVFYGWGLQLPHADKLALEYYIFKAAGMQWPIDEPIPEMVTERGASGEKTSSWLKDVIILRPAFFMDPRVEDDKKSYRASTDMKKLPATISRKAVANFIVKECLERESRWKNTTPVVGW